MSDSKLEMAKHIWGLGDYSIVGEWFSSASVRCLDGLDLAGKRLLDVACGTGNVSIEAARRGASVTALDLTPSMLSEAMRRASAAGVEIDFVEGSFTDLSSFSGFDVVTSAFGVIFSSDQAQTARELTNTVAVGGRVHVAAWNPDGAFGTFHPELTELLPGMAEGPPTGRWATEKGISEIFDGLNVRPLEPIRGRVIMPFESLDHVLDQFFTHSGPWVFIADVVAKQGQTPRLRSLLEKTLSPFLSSSEEGVELAVDYTVSRLERVG